MAQDTTASSSKTSSATSAATSSASSHPSSTHIITIVTAVIFDTLGLILLMSVFGFMLKKRGLRRTKSNDFEKNNPYQNRNTGNKAMSTANLPSFAWERTTQAPAELAIAAQNERSKLLNNNRATEPQLKMNRTSNVGQGNTQTLTPLLRVVDDGNVATTITPDPHRHAQSAGDNVVAYITYNDPGFTSNHCLSSTGLVPLQIERQPSPPSPLVSKHGSLHSITTCTATSSSGPSSSATDSRPSTRSASTSQKLMTSSLPPPLPPSICIQPHTPVVESHDEPRHHMEPENKKAKEGSPKLVPSTLPSPPITPSSFYSSPSSSSCSVNTTAAAAPTPPTTTSASMASSISHLPPSLRPGNAGNRATLALPVPAAAYLGSSNDISSSSSSTASKRSSMPVSTVRAGSTRRRTLSNPLHIQLHLNPLQQIAPAPATAVPSHHRHSRSHSTGRDSTSSNGSHGSGASPSSSSSSSSSSSASASSANNTRQSSGDSHNDRTARHHKRLSTFDAHRLSEQVAAREWAQARARSRSASRSSVNLMAGEGRYYAGGNGAGTSAVSLVPAQAEDGEKGASSSGGTGAGTEHGNGHLTVERRGEGDKSEGEGEGEEKRRRRRTISGDWLRGRNRDRSASKAGRNMALFCK